MPKLSNHDDRPSPRRLAFSSSARFWSSLTRIWMDDSLRSAFGFRRFMAAIVATKEIESIVEIGLTLDENVATLAPWHTY